VIVTLTAVRGNGFDRVCKARMHRRIDGSVPDACARGILAEEIVALPVARRPNRSRSEAAATVRTYVVQHLVDACRAKGAFIAADARFQRIGGKGLAAVFAGRSELEHDAND